MYHFLWFVVLAEAVVIAYLYYEHVHALRRIQTALDDAFAGQSEKIANRLDRTSARIRTLEEKAGLQVWVDPDDQWLPFQGTFQQLKPASEE
ncbi:hypothetical protein KDX14_27690 [Burkholderia cenocepacia]|uniref:hypothetical protein n=1 Tax=Burkholderia cepacia complex TaxID=87882 RepID=UPI000F5B3E1E|nr:MULTISPECIES: hypothetical protein [Burkholderia cepacia complex]MBR8073313.1 hypothetical protein [Burkholderia cenocepacia]RQS79766.1 hypothetical protein DF032_14435 [Burkholderia seminalis]